ncbi:MAG: hypothetical protein WC026_06120 [Hyphomicrobium sp.]|uniref:hypothetical protein n=1 Tax=Hyphomicrobium sp. TaxID=82 RepID=UPI003565DBED
MAKKVQRKQRLTQAEQSRLFIEKARELGVDETSTGQDRAFGKVGLPKPKNTKAKQK